MLKNSRNKENYIEKVNRVIEKVKKQGFTDIRADVGNYERPPRLISKSREVDFIPDVVARKNGFKGYFEISKKEKDTNSLVNKWSALSMLANMKNGIFRIYVPHGHMKFTRQLLTAYDIKAEVIKL
ncbi:MAG: hypothetical protein KFF73_00165 [Cyclobacteriaceae bacterium]|nr:hypothetical protein [Cyclobacteriaceae bacterium]